MIFFNANLITSVNYTKKLFVYKYKPEWRNVANKFRSFAQYKPGNRGVSTYTLIDCSYRQ